MAHTNCPSSRNKKRYQDIRELLCAGIDVYTTVNVQHIDSLNNVIEKITSIRVSERIPDDVFNQADQINQSAIRAASRLATAFKAEFTAFYIWDLEMEHADCETDVNLRQNLELAEQLGAKISVVYAKNLSNQIVAYAKISHVSKLVIGKSFERRRWPKENIIDVLSQSVPNLDILLFLMLEERKCMIIIGCPLLFNYRNGNFLLMTYLKP
ncbi:hypothetical protein [Streptococcus catagoni]|uniref:hypothetical protein n=1 Tax=Streptococcus catagoni TaxID=2654874 RepID=UPI001F15A2B9|nr:hypothetical protein [Streptococcus catagoni]